eukprot:UN04427
MHIGTQLILPGGGSTSNSALPDTGMSPHLMPMHSNVMAPVSPRHDGMNELVNMPSFVDLQLPAQATGRNDEEDDAY